jgi:hypothetical protein
VDNVYASPVLLGDVWKQKYEDIVVVSPDVGGVVRARALAKRLDDATSRSSTSAVRAERVGGHEHHRRGRGQDLRADRRHGRHGGHAVPSPRRR